jgi:tRNA(Arg) A34 adenosine deaminase TadA
MSSLYNLERIAYQESLKTGDTKQFFGCLILRQKRVISKGHNFRAFDKESCCCHAEMDAIYRHLSQLNLWKVFYRVLKHSYRYTGVMRGVAEVYSLLGSCLQKVPRIGKKRKYKMYVYRFYSSGECSNAKPCAECTRWISIASHLGVEYDIYYTSSESTLLRFMGDCNHYSPLTTYF